MHKKYKDALFPVIKKTVEKIADERIVMLANKRQELPSRGKLMNDVMNEFFDGLRKQLEQMVEKNQQFFALLKEDDSEFHNSLLEAIHDLEKEANINEQNILAKEITDELTEAHISKTMKDKIYIMGKGHFVLKEYDKALPFFHFLTCIEPDNDNLWLMKGITEQRGGFFQQALLSYVQSIQIAPNNLYAYLYLIDCFLVAEDFASAEEVYNVFRNENHFDSFEKDPFFQKKWKELQARFEPKNRAVGAA